MQCSCSGGMFMVCCIYMGVHKWHSVIIYILKGDSSAVQHNNEKWNVLIRFPRMVLNSLIAFKAGHSKPMFHYGTQFPHAHGGAGGI